jgi:hypothetical protein
MSTPIGQLGIEQQDSFSASMPMEQPPMNMGPPQQPMGNMNPPTDDSMMSQVMDRVQGMDNDPHASNISGEMMSHNMDPSQIPPEQQYQHMPEDQMMYQEHEPEPLQEMDESWSQKLQQGVRGPFIVFIIALLINLPHVTRMLTHFIPKLLQESGQLNIYGVAFKALLIAFLYAMIAYASN